MTARSVVSTYRIDTSEGIAVVAVFTVRNPTVIKVGLAPFAHASYAIIETKLCKESSLVDIANMACTRLL
jgi:hypothetical protein